MSSAESPNRAWDPNRSVVFRKTREKWGGLSNMAAGYPITVNETRFLTSEALYQAMRFPEHDDVQALIIEQASPMAAKMKSKPFRSTASHPNWESIRVDVMRWCLRLKLAQHWDAFGALLVETDGHDIVEESRRDQFWGAVRHGDRLRGANVLGQLLMELRIIAEAGGPPSEIAVPDLGLKLMGEPVRAWRQAEHSQNADPMSPSSSQQLGFDWNE